MSLPGCGDLEKVKRDLEKVNIYEVMWTPHNGFMDVMACQRRYIYSMQHLTFLLLNITLLLWVKLLLIMKQSLPYLLEKESPYNLVCLKY